MVSSTSIAASETDDASIWSKRTVMADMPHIQQLVRYTNSEFWYILKYYLIQFNGNKHVSTKRVTDWSCYRDLNYITYAYEGRENCRVWSIRQS